MAAITATCLGVVVPRTASAVPPPILSESFTGVNTPAGTWISGGAPPGAGQLGFACLTAAPVTIPGSIPTCQGGPTDIAGNGALRLTSNAVDQAGFAILNTPFQAGQGVHMEFDMYQYNSSVTPGGDGIAFFLINGAANPTVSGSTGGSLGYGNGTGFPGLVGGHIGVAFDAWGNFSDPTGNGGGLGGPGRRPNHITLRGAESTNYAFLATYDAATAGGGGGLLAEWSVPTRALAQRHVVVTISKSNVMNVFVDYGAGPIHQVVNIDLDTLPGQPAVPNTFKLGFAAGTGSNTDVHEIQGFVVQALEPDLDVTVSAPGGLTQATPGTVQIDVHNSPAAGSTYDTVTVTSTLPPDLTPTTASGPGWDCSISGQTVTCTRPGTGTDALPSDASYPPIQVGVDVSPFAPSTVPVSGTVAVLDDTGPANNTNTANLAVATNPPDLTVTVTPDSTGNVIVGVSNLPGAGATTDTVTVTTTIPDGFGIESATGDGWSCAVTGQTVTCTRPATGADAISGGQSFPDITIKTIVPLLGGPISPLFTASVATTGDSDITNNDAQGLTTFYPLPPATLAKTGENTFVIQSWAIILMGFALFVATAWYRKSLIKGRR